MSTFNLSVSAPGKIILAGGYLVLEAPNVALVLAVDKRFYCRATFLTLPSNTNALTRNAFVDILVHSIQFQQSWKYRFHPESGVLLPDTRDNHDSSFLNTNPLIEKTLRVIMLYLSHTSACLEKLQQTSAIQLEIRADNDFYSLIPHLQQRGFDRSWQSIQSLPNYLPVVTRSTVADENDQNNISTPIHKTGLGSSACLVTSLVGACLYFFHTQSTKEATMLNTIHNLAQICHCHAQGKIGSGFDVSAACFGSQVYQRFSYHKLQELLSNLDEFEQTTVPKHNTASYSRVQSLLYETVQAQWNGGLQQPITLSSSPTSTTSSSTSSLLQVSMADVSGGSESPGMARAVMHWKQSGRDTSDWDTLVQINLDIVTLFQKIENEQRNLTDNDRDFLAATEATRWIEKTNPVVNTLLELRQAFLKARKHLKSIGDAAGVPIEPDVQTSLANATMQLPGVVAALIPGAGGYDALVCIHINDDKLRYQIADMWADWSPTNVCALTVRGADYGAGVRLETPMNKNS